MSIMQVFIRISLFLLINNILAEKDNKNGDSKSSNFQYEESVYNTDCSKLLPGQFLCLDLNIDPRTQQPSDCDPVLKRANVTCQAAPGIICESSGNSTFTGTIPCKPTNGYHHDTALLLSVFLGMFGADRFYLGYHATGLAKLCTMGFLFVGQLVDIILIASHTLGPADGSAYVSPYYGGGLTVLRTHNRTFRLPQPHWQPNEL